MPSLGNDLRSIASAARNRLRTALRRRTAPPWHANLTDHEFLDEAFKRIFGRPVDPDARVLYAGKLAAEWSREELWKVLESSPEARATRPAARAWHATLTDDEFLDEAFKQIFGRPVDPSARVVYTKKLATEWSRDDLWNVLESSPEAQAGPGPRLALEAFHTGRIAWTRSLPRARRILDLGGTSLDTDEGALLAMGYPYEFDELIIIELLPEDRHQLYQVPEMKSVSTAQGPVRYLYRSMTDLADLPDASFDLICSGQTFEHIHPDEGAKMLHDIRRLLKPTGYLALDTPNRAITKIEVESKGIEFINPDHKIEYTHQQMLDLFADAGLQVTRQHGIGLMPESAATGQWLVEELIEYPGLYEDIERCYTLAYLAAPRPAG